jgi:hypothetical protein
MCFRLNGPKVSKYGPVCVIHDRAYKCNWSYQGRLHTKASGIKLSKPCWATLLGNAANTSVAMTDEVKMLRRFMWSSPRRESDKPLKDLSNPTLGTTCRYHMPYVVAYVGGDC